MTKTPNSADLSLAFLKQQQVQNITIQLEKIITAPNEVLIKFGEAIPNPDSTIFRPYSFGNENPELAVLHNAEARRLITAQITAAIGLLRKEPEITPATLNKLENTLKLPSFRAENITAEGIGNIQQNQAYVGEYDQRFRNATAPIMDLLRSYLKSSKLDPKWYSSPKPIIK